MPREGLKWRVNGAVQDSDLPPPSRLIMLVLSDMADARTGEIPAKQTPSVAELARRTGLKETAVKTHRALLERSGWIVIVRPSSAEAARHVPSRYRIAVGDTPTGGRLPTPEECSSEGCDTTPDADTRGSGDDPRNEDRGSLGDPSGVARRRPRGSLGDPLPITNDRNDQDDHLLGADAPSEETDGALFGADAEGVEKRPENKPDGKPKRKKKPEPQRDDVDALCHRLAELMIANECKPPTISEEWRREARLLLDRDGRDFDKAMTLLEWSQNDPFWKGNIHSLPTFRAKYDQLRQRALAEWERQHTQSSNVVPLQRGSAPGPYQNPTDPNAYRKAIS